MPVIEDLPDGHRLWFHAETTAPQPNAASVFMLDESGDTPHDTDDGPLRLNLDEPLRVGCDGSDFVAVPLVNAQGERTRTPSDAATILRLAARFGWTVTDGEHTYAIARIGR